MLRELIIITGLSGAGKNVALSTFEDFGYFCVDNMPPTLVDNFLNMLLLEDDANKIALSIDIRSKKFSANLKDVLQNVQKNKNFNVKIVYLDCATQTLVNRYKETRKNHPLANEKNLVDGIESERNIMACVKGVANYIYDTTNTTVSEFKEKVLEDFAMSKKNKYHVTVSSFGYKYGVPIDADNIIDVRFLKNPFYVDELREHTGLDEDVYNYVFNDETTKEFYEKFKDTMLYMIDKYQYEGRDKVSIAIGCTGGKHRSVSIARKLFEDVKKEGHTAYINHRDIEIGR